MRDEPDFLAKAEEAEVRAAQLASVDPWAAEEMRKLAAEWRRLHALRDRSGLNPRDTKASD